MVVVFIVSVLCSYIDSIVTCECSIQDKVVVKIYQVVSISTPYFEF